MKVGDLVKLKWKLAKATTGLITAKNGSVAINVWWFNLSGINYGTWNNVHNLELVNEYRQ
jgi:hypothetical protein|tara:strand:+ start:359 stop:538 length:180 start_codon:yes stop_codon:yes gene_type:complete